jgi:hypothetical protein
MIPLDYILAAALLAAPSAPAAPSGAVVVCRAEEERPVGEGLSSLAPTVAVLAIHLEIMDRREAEYLLAGPEEFVADLTLVRERGRTLADAPPLCDCQRFPGRMVASELLEFNRAYRHHLLRKQDVEGLRRDEVAEALHETDVLYRIWDAVRDARSECYYVMARRNALRVLREALGQEAYYRGDLPPHVPIWRFARVE